MKKRNLKTGMLVVLRDNSIGIVLLETERGNTISNGFKSPYEKDENLQHTWGPLESWDENLLFTEPDGSYHLNSEGDVMQVWSEPRGRGNQLLLAMSLNNRELLWKREKFPKWTVLLNSTPQADEGAITSRLYYFFDNEDSAKALFEKFVGTERCPTKRPFHSRDVPFLPEYHLD